ncbi:MAG: response regulator [Acidobacteria bacterium]|nr:response regulator [Acidobacteriota bacterium]
MYVRSLYPCGCRLSTLLAALLLGAVLATSAEAQPTAPGDLWRWSRFTTLDGLPSDRVVDAVEAYDGTMWVLAGGDIAYFDGFRWREVPLPAGFEQRAFHVAALSGSGLAVLAPSQLLVGDRHGFRVAEAAADGTSRRWRAIAGARNGPLLLLDDAGMLFEWDGKTFRPHEAGARFGRVLNLYQAGSAAAWISADQGLYCWDGTTWRSRMPPGTDPYLLSTVIERPDEGAYAYIESPQSARGLWRWDTSNSTAPRGTRQPILSQTVSLAVTLDGNILAAHQTGELTVLRNQSWGPLTTRFAEMTDAHGIGVRANGDVWVTSDHGLFLASRSVTRWTFLSFPSADGRNGVNDIYRGHDGMWLATANGLVRVQRNGEVSEHIQRIGREALGTVTGVMRDSRGRLWISSGGSFTGVRWLDRKGWHRLTDDPLLDRTYVHHVASDSGGGVWFLGLASTAGAGETRPIDGPGAFQLGPDGRITRWSVAEGLKSGRVYAFAEAPDGAFWFGTSGGLSRFFHGQWRHWTLAEGLAFDRIFSLAVDLSGAVWFGHQTKGGLGRLQGDTIRYFTSRDGLASDDVWSVQPDARGRVWVSCLGGLSVLEDGNWTTFDTRAGLRSTRVWPVRPAADYAYIGTNGGGLAVLDVGNPSPPPIVINEPPVTEADAVQVSWRAFAWWGELASDDVPTRVRIDEGPWAMWSTERTRRFGSLASGDHVVRIQAKGLLGHPGPVATIPVSIARPFYLRPAFYVPMATLGIISLGLVVNLGIRRRRHHRELQEREQRFSQIFHSSPLATGISSPEEGRIVDINEEFARRFGYTHDEVIGRTVTDIGFWIRPEDRAAVVSALDDPDGSHRIETQLRCKSGEVADVVLYPARIEIGGKPSLVWQILDVTAQRRLEAQLQQAHKMESVGRLAGGIAHDFNNLLTIIMGNASLLDDALEPGDERHGEVGQIQVAAERAEKLTRQLLAFARKQIVEPRTVNLNDLVLRTDRMLRRLIGEHVELVTILAPDAMAVHVDPAQIEQVLLNLAVNARDAMLDGGTLTLRTANVEMAEGDPTREPDTPPGAYVRLSVVDTGTGMDGRTAAHVFDPFFTTKAAGKGTGLGLATCYGIVKQLRGQITIDTARGRGTAFHVDLPVATSPAQVEETPEERVELPRGSEVVLLVEDEVQVRRLAASILRQRGYDVFEAANGPEALGFEAGHEGPIDILVTDIVMPQMRGTELASRLKPRRPDMKVLFMSGYTDDQMFRQEVGTGSFAFLAKPFTPASLASKVREQLDSSAT